jgi:hypothetical protein
MNLEKVQEIFCEMVTGIAVFLLLPPLLEFTDVITVKKVISDHVMIWDVAQVGVFLISAYCIGLIFDAIGLSCGEIFLDDWLADNIPPKKSSSKFWSNVSPEVLTYRNSQWAYYSFFRNLILLMPPLALLWIILLWNYSPIWMLLVGIAIVFTWLALIKSGKVLLSLYYKITEAVGTTENEPEPSHAPDSQGSRPALK